MPHNYRRQTDQWSWDPRSMLEAVVAIRNGDMKNLKAAKQFVVQKEVLTRYFDN